MSSTDFIPDRARPTALAASVRRVLEDCHILVAEDDYYQGDGIVACLNDAGAIVIGPACNHQDAMHLAIANDLKAAIVDINLGDGTSFELALHLRRSDVPFLFVTGYDCGDVPAELGDIACLEKPFTEHDLLQATARAINGGLAA